MEFLFCCSILFSTINTLEIPIFEHLEKYNEKINLYKLADKAIGVSQKVGDFLGEAAQVCLEMQGHKSGVQLNITGQYEESVILEWSNKLEEETLLSWRDLKESTEYGATAIALLLLIHFESYNFVERLPQTAIADYFLKKRKLEDEITKHEIFLEISGIFRETSKNTIDIRIKQKKKQIANKSIAQWNILIAVVEFSKPKAKITKI